MKVIILAGGGGTRLFPLSRASFPKQFLKIQSEKSLLAKTIVRFLLFVKPEDILIVTNKEYLYHVENDIAECEAGGVHVIVEPIGRNTAPAIALAVKFCMDELNCPNHESIIVAAADHVIEDEDAFVQSMKCGIGLASKNYLAIFGIKPDSPKTGYGYIETGEKIEDYYAVKSFKEKPSVELAKQYVESGIYYWNSGMFAFTIEFILKEFQKFKPEIMKNWQASYESFQCKFIDMPNISIDYAVVERSHQVMMVPLTCYWNDIGSWDAMYEILPKDQFGNAMIGDCMAIECNNSLMIGRDRLIAGIGFDDLLLVETDDVIVVAKKGESQKVKTLVERLKANKRKEAEEHTTIYRPWGSMTVLGEGSGYRMKRVKINPNGEIRSQMHYHRSEHWIVISGTAKVTIHNEVKMIHENESVFIPQTIKHKLENPGKIPLIIIEVQNGTYIGEDDIIRFD